MNPFIPKIEIRIPESRRPKCVCVSWWKARAKSNRLSRRVRASGFGFHSELGFRVSDFKLTSLVWRSGLVALWLAIAPLPATAQAVSPWPAGMPPPFLQGPTLEATLRNGVQTASDQARLTAQAATEMGRRSRGVAYQLQNLWNDYQLLEMQFQNLRTTFSAVAGLAAQLQSARALNAAAELEAGLNILSEAFAPVQQELQAGTLNRDTVQRMCQVLNEALLEWQKELKRCSSRLGMIR
jgi:hypothetical protein